MICLAPELPPKTSKIGFVIVGLQGTAAVNGDDVLPGPDQGICLGDLTVIQGHRPVAHDDPAVEKEILVEEVVVLHALPGPQLFQPVLPGNPAMDEEVVVVDQNGGHGLQEGQLLGVGFPDGLPGGGIVLHGLDGDPDLMGHVHPGGLVLPEAPVPGGDLVGPLAAEKAQGGDVAVALDEVDGVGLGQVHEIPEGVQAPGGFFQNVPQDDQDILRRKARFVQQAFQIGQVAVDIADDQHPQGSRSGNSVEERSQP